MDINNPIPLDHILTQEGTMFKIKELDIPAWNMTTTLQVMIAHGLADEKKVVGFSFRIHDDSVPFTIALFPNHDPIAGKMSVYYSGIDDVYIYLQRESPSLFTMGNHTSMALPRGLLWLWYKG